MPELLIVDDEPAIVYVLRMSQESYDTTVGTTQTARLGITATTKDKPVGVLLHVRLPDLSGLDSGSEQRGHHRRPGVVVTLVPFD
jgi:two-component system nitrogen regulation response regulator GlnG